MQLYHYGSYQQTLHQNNLHSADVSVGSQSYSFGTFGGDRKAISTDSPSEAVNFVHEVQLFATKHCRPWELFAKHRRLTNAHQSKLDSLIKNSRENYDVLPSLTHESATDSALMELHLPNARAQYTRAVFYKPLVAAWLIT